jgi:CubicO group peptidase (beta-lactamase class C family)
MGNSITSRTADARLVISVVIFCLLMISACSEPPKSAAQNELRLDESVLSQSLDSIAIENAVVGYSIGLVADGRLAYAHAFGETELGSSTRLTTKSIFHWASVSKPFVATAIMQLSERGELDLDAHLVDVLPEYKTSDTRHAEVSIRELLLHTSGLPDVEDYQWDKPEYDDGALRRWVLDESPRDLLFDPGSDRQYSNVGFEILGLVIEQVSGLSFEDYMKRNIFDPLGMSDTTFYYPDVPETLRTVGHTDPTQRRPVNNYPYNRRHAPSSTLNTNVEDMARFVLALLNEGELDGVRILKSSTLDDMWTPRWVMHETPLPAAAMGWVVEDFNGHRMVRHFGSDDGFKSALLIFPDDESGLFLVTNDETTPMPDVARAALGELLAE